MAIDLKYGQIDIPRIGEDEPVFILRAQDKAALAGIHGYIGEAATVGATMEFQQGVVAALNFMNRWQQDNLDKVKTPD